MICEPSSFIQFTSGLSRHLNSNSKLLNEGERPILLVLQIPLRDHDQYYVVAVATLYFYDYFLTLADEVNHPISISLP